MDFKIQWDTPYQNQITITIPQIVLDHFNDHPPTLAQEIFETIQESLARQEGHTFLSSHKGGGSDLYLRLENPVLKMSEFIHKIKR